MDGAVAGHAAIPRKLLLIHAKMRAAMFDEHVVFFEGVGVEQHFQPLARGELAFFMLRVDALFTAAHTGGVTAAFQLQIDGDSRGDGG